MTGRPPGEEDCGLQTPLRTLGRAKPPCLVTPAPVAQQQQHDEGSEEEEKGWAVARAAMANVNHRVVVNTWPISAPVVPTPAALRGSPSQPDPGAPLSTASLTTTPAPGSCPVKEAVAMSRAWQLLQKAHKEQEDTLQLQLALQQPALLMLEACKSTAPLLAQLSHKRLSPYAEALLKATASSHAWQQKGVNPHLHQCSLPQPPLLIALQAVFVGSTSATTLEHHKQLHLPSQPHSPCPALPSALKDATACSRQWLLSQTPSPSRPDKPQLLPDGSCQVDPNNESVTANAPVAARLDGSCLVDSAIRCKQQQSSPPNAAFDAATSCNVMANAVQPQQLPTEVAGDTMPRETEAANCRKQNLLIESWGLLGKQLGFSSEQPPELQTWLATAPRMPRSKQKSAAGITFPNFVHTLGVCTKHQP